MSQQYDSPPDPIVAYSSPPHRVIASPHDHADASDDELGADVWRDIGPVDAPLAEESPEISAFIAQHDLREVIVAMRSRALELFRDVRVLYTELGDDMLWLRLETSAEVDEVSGHYDEFLDWFVERYPAEVTTHVQLHVRFVVS